LDTTLLVFSLRFNGLGYREALALLVLRY